MLLHIDFTFRITFKWINVVYGLIHFQCHVNLEATQNHMNFFIHMYMEGEFEKSICVLKKNLSDWIYIYLNFLRFKVALYTKGSTIYETTSQYGDLNILWNCFYRSTLLCIKWLSGIGHGSYEPHILSSKPLETW